MMIVDYSLCPGVNDCYPLGGFAEVALGWIEDFAAALVLEPGLPEFFGLVDSKKFLAELKKAVEDLTW